MGIMDDIDDMGQWSEVEVVNDVCEICYQEDFQHESYCPNSDDSRFFDEEMVIAEEEGLL